MFACVGVWEVGEGGAALGRATASRCKGGTSSVGRGLRESDSSQCRSAVCCLVAM